MRRWGKLEVNLCTGLASRLMEQPALHFLPCVRAVSISCSTKPLTGVCQTRCSQGCSTNTLMTRESVILLFTFTLKLYELGTWHLERMFTSLHMAHVRCHVSRVTCHKSHSTLNLFWIFFYLIFYWQSGGARVVGGSVINKAYPV